jgi:hypothetical protein
MYRKEVEEISGTQRVFDTDAKIKNGVVQKYGSFIDYRNKM